MQSGTKHIHEFQGASTLHWKVVRVFFYGWRWGKLKNKAIMFFFQFFLYRLDFRSSIFFFDFCLGL